MNEKLPLPKQILDEIVANFTISDDIITKINTQLLNDTKKTGLIYSEIYFNDLIEDLTYEQKSELCNKIKSLYNEYDVIKDHLTYFTIQCKP